jgi:hypothetical protein
MNKNVERRHTSSTTTTTKLTLIERKLQIELDDANS